MEAANQIKERVNEARSCQHVFAERSSLAQRI
jgi:hypothetical protein